jgi:hypothetical protein
MARFPGFIGGTYQLQSVNADCQRCCNLFPQVNEARTAGNGEIGSLFRTPGLTLLGTIGLGPIRGLYTASNGNLYCVSGAGLYQVSTGWVGTLLGTLGTTTGRVEFSDNGVQLMITDGQGYVLTFGGNVFLPLVGTSGWLGSYCVGYLDQWGIFAVPGSSAFYTSDQLDFATYDGLNVAYKQGFNDPIVSLIVDKGNVWLLGRDTSEVWYNAQNAPPGIVLSRVPGSLLEIGCCSPYSPQKVMNTLLWLGDGKHGAGVVWQANGYVAERKSTHAVEIALQSYGYENLQKARAWTYEQDGHGFYCLNVPGAPVTWVYDVVTGQWHERSHLANGIESRNQADCHAWANGQHVVGDYQTGAIYALDKTNFTDNGLPLRWLRRAPHLTEDMAWIFYNSFQLDLETGVGLDGTQQGIDPQIMLRYSNDSGHTWSNEIWRTAGTQGSYRTRAIWRSLGRARNRVFEVSGSDPVACTLLGAELGVMPGRS